MSKETIARCYTCRHRYVSVAEQPCRDCPTRLRLFETNWKPVPALPPAEEARGCATCEYLIPAACKCAECDLSTHSNWEARKPAPAPKRLTLADVLPAGTELRYKGAPISFPVAGVLRDLTSINGEPGNNIVRPAEFEWYEIILPDPADAHCGRQTKP